MKMLKLILIPIIFISVSVGCEIAYAQNDKVPREFVTDTLKDLATKNYDELANRFHMPPEYPNHVRQEETCSIKYKIVDMVELFGVPERIGILKNRYPYDLIGFGGGSIPYWIEHPKSIVLTFNAFFPIAEKKP